jgi:hypothetical protein
MHSAAPCLRGSLGLRTPQLIRELARGPRPESQRSSEAISLSGNRYHVINVDDLRQAALRGAAYSGESATAVPIRAAGENPERTW